MRPPIAPVLTVEGPALLKAPGQTRLAAHRPPRLVSRNVMPRTLPGARLMPGPAHAPPTLEDRTAARPAIGQRGIIREIVRDLHAALRLSSHCHRSSSDRPQEQRPARTVHHDGCHHHRIDSGRAVESGASTTVCPSSATEDSASRATTQ